MGPIDLQAVDTPMLDETNWGPNASQWLTTLVDIINAAFSQLNSAFAGLLAVGQIDVGGSGAGPITVVVTGLMASNFVNVSLVSSTNDVTISSVVVGAGSFDITFSGDPGPSAIIVYQAFVSQPQ